MVFLKLDMLSIQIWRSSTTFFGSCHCYLGVNLGDLSPRGGGWVLFWLDLMRRWLVFVVVIVGGYPWQWAPKGGAGVSFAKIWFSGFGWLKLRWVYEILLSVRRG